MKIINNFVAKHVQTTGTGAHTDKTGNKAPRAVRKNLYTREIRTALLNM